MIKATCLIADLKRIITSSAQHVAIDENSILSCVNIRFKKKKLQFTALDEIHLVMLHLPINLENKMFNKLFSINIEACDLKKILPLLKAEEPSWESVSIELNCDDLTVRQLCNGNSITIKGFDGLYPNFDKLIPEYSKYKETALNPITLSKIGKSLASPYSKGIKIYKDKKNDLGGIVLKRMQANGGVTDDDIALLMPIELG